jgi:hypothetical protein
VSLLPSFALSYRLLNARLVERFLTRGEVSGVELRWQNLLRTYRARIETFLPRLRSVLGTGLGVAPPVEGGASGFCTWLTALCGGVGRATEQLVNVFAVSLFGFYRCHTKTR